MDQEVKQSAQSIKKMSYWAVYPTSDGICLYGKVAESLVMTMNIEDAWQDEGEKFVRLTNNITFALQDRADGTWEIYLQRKRPREHDMLKSQGII